MQKGLTDGDAQKKTFVDGLFWKRIGSAIM